MSALASAVSTSSASNVSQELPSHHFTAEEVQDDCQVQPSFHRGDVSDVADPDLIDSTMLIAFFKISRWRLRYSFSFCSCRIFSNISSGLSGFPSSSPGFNCPRYALFHSVSV